MADELARDPELHEIQFKKDMVALIPSLRAFARGLCRDREFADDLAQEAMMRAWAGRATYTPGTNFRAWMFQILRHQFYNSIRKNAMTTVWDPEAAERLLVQDPTQEHRIHIEDVNRALHKLPIQQREMLLLIAGAGMKYEDAALIAGCTIGTVKSRLNRARISIRAIVDGTQQSPMESDVQTA